ncbi:MAG: cyclic pyranopterin monophosphate synthase MoaC [Coriobacteriaceae bacterium]|nr:cyclic pyranopterin monophosphate synthase MoaC [Coriobacteriaceae bacterium]
MTARTPDKPERPKTLGRTVHEKYPAAVVGESPNLTLVEGGGGARDAYRDELTHVDEHGDVRMVDVGAKAVTQRLALAEASILMHPETQAMVLEDRAKKGDVLACARVAGIMASKRTSDLIPMCHPLNITKAKVDIEPIAAAGADPAEGWAPAREDGRVGFHVLATCGVTGVTGIEMEALTAASTACLTIYDMCKAADRGMEIVDVRLLRKEGGRSGVWERAGLGETEAERSDDAGLGADGEPETASNSGHTLTSPAGEPEPDKLAPSALPGGPRTGAAAPAIAFVGYQNAGKTTLVEKVISRLTQRGLRVGSIKHHGHKGFEIDQPGKDSWRHAQAGSRHVGLVAPGSYAEYARIDGEVDVRDLVERYTDVDVVIVEGYKGAGLPSIVVTRSGIDRMRGRDSFELIDEHTLAVACNDVVTRDFRTKATKLARAAAEEAGTPFNEEDVALPPFIDINDSAAIASFVFDYVEKAQLVE